MIIDVNSIYPPSYFVTNESWVFLGALLTGLGYIFTDLFTWFVKKFTMSTFKLVIYYSVLVTSYGIYATIIAFSVSLVVNLHDIIMTLLESIESLSGNSHASCLATNISAGFNSSGILDGLIAGMPLINSAFAFFILSVFYIFLSKLRIQFTNYVLGSLKLIGN